MAILSLQGLTTIFDDLQTDLTALKKISKAAERENALMDLREKFVSVRQAAQASHSDLLQEVDKLKNELMGLKNWDREAARYAMKRLPPGVIVYELKAPMAAGEIPHEICEKCYQEGKKGLLHSDQPGNGIHHLTCNRCGTKLTVGHFSPPRVNTGGGGGWT